ncbi:MAG: hypothetical protein U0401_09160 [Anaerolineae bacterium]
MNNFASEIEVSNDIIFVPMTETEARQLVNEIKTDIVAVGQKLLELYEREGWRALGYANWRECVMTEFEFQKSHVYRLLDFARLERNLSPIGEKYPLPANEAQARPLAKLSAEQQRQVWTVAVETAPAGHLTAAHVERTARRLIQVFEEPEEFVCPRCGQRTAQVNEGTMCLSEACGAVWATWAEYEAELENHHSTRQPVEFPKILLLDRQRREWLRAHFAEAINYLPAEEYAHFVERVEELLREFNLLRRSA